MEGNGRQDRVRKNRSIQGFMELQIVASHTYFGGHTDANCEASLQTLNVFLFTRNGLQTQVTLLHLF